MKKYLISFLIFYLYLFCQAVNIKEVTLPGAEFKIYNKYEVCLHDSLIYLFYSYKTANGSFLVLDTYNYDHKKINTNEIVIDKEDTLEPIEIIVTKKNNLFLLWSKSKESINKQLYIQTFNIQKKQLNSNPLLISSDRRIVTAKLFNDESYIISDYYHFSYYQKKKLQWDYQIETEKPIRSTPYFIKDSNNMIIIHQQDSLLCVSKIDAGGNLVEKTQFSQSLNITNYYFIHNAFMINDKLIFLYSTNDYVNLISLSNDFKTINKREFGLKLKSNISGSFIDQPEINNIDQNSLLFSYTDYKVDFNSEKPKEEIKLIFEKLDKSLIPLNYKEVYQDNFTPEYGPGSSKGNPKIKSGYVTKRIEYKLLKTPSSDNLYLSIINSDSTYFFRFQDSDKPNLIFKESRLFSNELISLKKCLFEDNNYCLFLSSDTNSFLKLSTYTKNSFSIKSRTVLGSIKHGFTRLEKIIENQNGYFVFWVYTDKKSYDLYYAFINKELKIQTFKNLFSGDLVFSISGLIPCLTKDGYLTLYFGQDTDKNIYEYYFNPMGDFSGQKKITKPGNYNLKTNYLTDFGFIRCYHLEKDKRWYYDYYKENIKIKENIPLDSLYYNDNVQFNENFLCFFKNRKNNYYFYGQEDKLIPGDLDMQGFITNCQKYNDSVIFSFLEDNGNRSICFYNFITKEFYKICEGQYNIFSIIDNNLYILFEMGNSWYIGFYDIQKGVREIMHQKIELPVDSNFYRNWKIIPQKNGIILLSLSPKHIFSLTMNNNNLITKDISESFLFINKSYNVNTDLQYSFKDHEIIPLTNYKDISLIFIDKK